jgi:Bacterial protein of unknown function (DUF882)
MTHRSLPRAITLALALAAASLGPLVWSGTALAETPKGDAAKPAAPVKSDAAEGSKHAKPAAKGKGKAKKGATAKANAKSDKAQAKGGKSAGKATKSKRAARETKSSPKRAKPAPKADDSPRTGRAEPQAPCTGASVSFDRGGVEADRFALVDCHGKPQKSAVSKVSVLARPWGAPKRASHARVDAGVITRLEAIARKFPGKTISLAGGPRPSGNGASAHQSGRAIDVRVDGVDNKKVADVCRALPDTGCGYYPNAAFVHVDVRAPGAGSSYWIDASEPGEPPRYVTSWPPSPASKDETVKASASDGAQK